MFVHYGDQTHFNSNPNMENKFDDKNGKKSEVEL